MARTYTVYWSRKNFESDKLLKCSNLTARVAFKRLMGALEHDDGILIHKIEPESRRSD
jgi:hypothetical protein